MLRSFLAQQRLNARASGVWGAQRNLALHVHGVYQALARFATTLSLELAAPLELQHGAVPYTCGYRLPFQSERGARLAVAGCGIAQATAAAAEASTAYDLKVAQKDMAKANLGRNAKANKVVRKVPKGCAHPPPPSPPPAASDGPAIRAALLSRRVNRRPFASIPFGQLVS